MLTREKAKSRGIRHHFLFSLFGARLFLPRQGNNKTYRFKRLHTLDYYKHITHVIPRKYMIMKGMLACIIIYLSTLETILFFLCFYVFHFLSFIFILQFAR